MLHECIFLQQHLFCCIQCFDAVGWATGRASGLYKKLDVGLLMVKNWLEICTPYTSSCHHHHHLHHPCSNKIQNGGILVPAYPSCPGKLQLNECRECRVVVCQQHLFCSSRPVLWNCRLGDRKGMQPVKSPIPEISKGSCLVDLWGTSPNLEYFQTSKPVKQKLKILDLVFFMSVLYVSLDLT